MLRKWYFVVVLAALFAALIAGCGKQKPSISYESTPPTDKQGRAIDTEAARKVAAEFFGVSPEDVKLAPEEYRYARKADGSVGVLFELPGTEKAQCTVMVQPDGSMRVASASWFPPPEKVQPQTGVKQALSEEEAVELAKKFVAEHQAAFKDLGLSQKPSRVETTSDKVMVIWQTSTGENLNVEVARYARRVVGFEIKKPPQK